MKGTRQRIRLILSFDHELSLGGTESFAYNLFEPTNELFRVADELSLPTALFTDVLCAMRYEEWDRSGFFEPYRRQIGEALRRGHDVQLHIHPHWVDSTYEHGTYRPSRHFALSDFENAAPPDDIAGIIDRSHDFLTTLCREADPAYRCVAYRAGGHNLAPATAAILSALYEKGVRIDSSIVKGFRFHSGISAVDMTNMPAAPNWTIPVGGPLNANGDHGLYEIPVAAKPRTPLNNLPFLVNRVRHRARAHDPRGPSIHAAHTPLIQKLGRMFPRSAWALSFDDAAHSTDDVLDIFRAHVRAHGDAEQIVCAAVSHPKSMGAYAFSLMRHFVEGARREFGDALEFTTYRDVYNDLSSQRPGLNGRSQPGPGFATVTGNGDAPARHT